MIYFKRTDGKGNPANIEYWGDDFITKCPVCKKEHRVDLDTIEELLAMDTDFSEIELWCGACNKIFPDALKHSKGVSDIAIEEAARQILGLNLKKKIYHEAYGNDLKALEDCTIREVLTSDDYTDIKCVDEQGNEVNLLICEDGAMHLYDSRITEDE